MVGISALELLVWPLLPSGDPVCALIDARRGEVYCGAYRRVGAAVEKLVPDQVAAPDTAVERVPDACIFVGNGARLYRDEILAAKGDDARMAPRFLQFPDAATLAWLTAERLATRGQPAIALRPLYLRKSDAQIQRKCLTPKDPSAIVEKL